jgi:hypothetical protein
MEQRGSLIGLQQPLGHPGDGSTRVVAAIEQRLAVALASEFASSMRP